ncbi:hypothetical protein KFK09_022733 [Dendrobium nobile]|uniref:CCHC-type domain-containing protein n=1 Tax=Dendrobium nobile TaxID=94219 RepID=A0A8T3AJJ8_DENNO|nr:hypothetical protein KFK09_022733 [Dendrobium nobile]
MACGKGSRMLVGSSLRDSLDTHFTEAVDQAAYLLYKIAMVTLSRTVNPHTLFYPESKIRQTNEASSRLRRFRVESVCTFVFHFLSLLVMVKETDARYTLAVDLGSLPVLGGSKRRNRFSTCFRRKRKEILGKKSILEFSLGCVIAIASLGSLSLLGLISPVHIKNKNLRHHIDYRMWMLVNDGYVAPVKNVNGVKTPLPFNEWSNEDRELAQLNAKCLNCFFCALKSEDYMGVFTYVFGKEIWDRLCITYEGTNEVKQSRLNILLHDYELFHMKPSETISDMYTRFTQIMTSLHALGREISNSEKVNKILRCLPSSYDAKITAITESKEPNVYSIDNLLGSLIAYEQGVSQRLRDAGEKKKERTVELKASNSESESSAEEEEDKIALMTRQFKNFLKRKQKHHQNSWNKGTSSMSNKASSNTICFECKKLGHLRTDCPNLKSQPAKEKGDDKAKYNGCSRHMTGDMKKFILLETKTGGKVTLGDNTSRKVIGSGKFDLKSDEGVFLSYSSVGKAYRIFNKRTLVVEESTHVIFDESDKPSESKIEDDEIEAIQGVETMTLGERVKPQEYLPREWRYSSSHPKELILGDPSEGVITRHGLRKEVSHSAFISKIEPTSIDQALRDEFWILAMQEELNQFTRNDIWELVKRPNE